MKTVTQIFQQVKTISVLGNPEVEISQLTIDSRQVGPQTLFAALKGTQTDGHSYIEKAIELGASAILCEDLPEVIHPTVTYIQVNDSAESLGYASSNFYDNPSSKLKLVGITGTNGKTTTVTLLFRLFRKLGYRCGLISTVQNQIDDTVIPSTHTTPDSINLNKLLAEMVEAGCTYAFMEVSSHSVVQHRITGLSFTGAIFSNITHDHLDFHKTFDNYIKAKKGFFDMLPKTAFALVNIDDRRGSVMVQNTKASINTYSLETLATVKGRIVSDSIYGLEMEIDNKEVHFQLIGTFNAYNLMAIYGAAILLGEDKDEVLINMSSLQTAPGRFEQIVSPDTRKVGIVDYAHTPDALENVLKTIKQIKDGNQQVITIVGCGGNRDATKRPIMAKIACELSDKVILTSDNPRFEDPEEILAQMQKGVPPIDFKKTKTIIDRKEAIHFAINELSENGDIILVAGKGHETYQDIQGVKHDFDDRVIIREAFGI
ncbi:UDP-N-acetylmuramoyl-L-alanyl-D-glutamate--2,6-diaminopimelate ligase [Flectobacillus roseus]|jgi:UDP-N-acetylmuramoyl-L-alanyl-D-glutamate--2,6-diaminopimelate ligase|uniref:UDP-N-acetylmuramoyl-L-alanyl-D-glutamate--2, 6-diaminopimelate ligase n=1 Tax=Flectobacillus roseus TaxID=502259 RepID=UPI0024B7FA6A|nr:UDP-N-acetylmuramoyl-L-alanyl-D-glutamate--2,6-diaminopimelate ligase [Flectobacillus roseus]MDI9869132.1 UDP-N-acetylmuramoyl-L-alanyl-D-glutamate--2,6-diaminopimelate ligase [Flectobacillus roseus]